MRKSVAEATELAGLRYPSFVYGGGLPRGQIPVFCLHDVADERESFESQLRHFHRNGYVALTLDEYVTIIEGKQPAPERAFVLTFDDGYCSTWTMAVPLLKRYEMRATVFVIPERMAEGTTVRATLDQVWSGELSSPAFAEMLRSSPPLMSWEEVRRTRDSGVMDVQSHSMTHARVFTSPQVVGFVDPAFVRGANIFTLPMLRDGNQDVIEPQPRLGTPLYRSAPRLAAGRRYLECSAARTACLEHVERHGGAAFFERSDWKKELTAAEAEVRRNSGPPQFEDDETRRGAWRHELVESKRRVEQELPGHQVRHFAYPWGVGHPDVIALTRAAGYASSFWLKAHGCWSRLAGTGHDTQRLPRLQALWMRSVPGKGRQSLRQRLAFKAGRRFGAQRSVPGGEDE